MAPCGRRARFSSGMLRRCNVPGRPSCCKRPGARALAAGQRAPLPYQRPRPLAGRGQGPKRALAVPRGSLGALRAVV